MGMRLNVKLQVRIRHYRLNVLLLDQIEMIVQKIVLISSSIDQLEHKWVRLASQNVWLHAEYEDKV